MLLLEEIQFLFWGFSFLAISWSSRVRFRLFVAWSLRDGNVVFISDIISFIISRFIFSSCVKVCLGVFGCVVFRLQSLYLSIRLEGSCFPVFSISILVLGSSWYDSLFICWCISSTSRSENQPFFIITRAWSANLWLVLNLVHYSQIWIILFLYYFCVKLLLTVKCNLIVFPSRLSLLFLLSVF